MGSKIYCAICGNRRNANVVGTLRWEGSTFPGRGRNIIETHMCSSCMEAAQFTKTCVDDGSFISLVNYDTKGEW